MKFRSPLKAISAGAPITLLLVVVSMKFVDPPLAAGISHYSGAYAHYVRALDISDLLALIVAVITTLSWAK